LWGARDCWLYGELLACYWYKEQAVLLYTDQKRQAFRIASK